jgi:hypothetical protein
MLIREDGEVFCVTINWMCIFVLEKQIEERVRFGLLREVLML